ncbi:hypothetical protein IAG44_40550 [Streptomyces roseirectus]|uniref:Uncharacterized protein n=1 Tax=Streptomyces roseirectus TaxID=2768066 RepID=A0A7H0IQL9_9ACTN|nr:hypothetical protein [Streptomyces roseirectus]QNP75085.1 hypothetical protein IAG44_40550 [Streptomyces roseirectus]
MSNTENVPEFAQLNNGMKPEDLKDAISRSGYPFQAITAASLRSLLAKYFNDVSIQEEWEYIDSETQQARSVDILADMGTLDFDQRVYKSPAMPLFCRLNLVIECKQSENPYIFFLRDAPPEGAPSFPEMIGPVKGAVKVFERTEEGEISDRAAILSVRDLLGFYEFDFVLPPLPYAVSLAKALRSKSKVEVTGEETYRALTYPLLKAVDHLKATVQSGPQPSQERFIVPIAVVRAPMVGSIFSPEGEQRLISLPWVRVSRLEPVRNAADGKSAGTLVRYYDVVHESYLDTYMGALAAAIINISKRIMEHPDELRSGAGSSRSFVQPYRSLEVLPEDFRESSEKLPTYMKAIYPSVTLEEGQERDHESMGAINFIDWTFPNLSM